MKKTIKGFILGLIATTLLMSTATGSGLRERVDVVFNSVNLTVNGIKVEADNILYKGTTYVPLRATAQMLGKQVDWNTNTRTANIGDKTKNENEDNELKEDVSREYKSALKQAEFYARDMNLSKARIYDQLVSEYGEKFPKDAAQYAIDNLKANWKENALKQAKFYANDMNLSKARIYDQLISEYGEKFTKEEAQYAIDNLE